MLDHAFFQGYLVYFSDVEMLIIFRSLEDEQFIRRDYFCHLSWLVGLSPDHSSERVFSRVS